MLLQALHKYAQERRLLDDLPFQRRTLHLLVPLRADGTVRGEGLVVLTTRVDGGKQSREEMGRDFLLPRFPGEKNQGKASYLADPFNVVFGMNKENETPLLLDEKGPDRDAVRAHRMFWKWIEDAHIRLRDSRLSALLACRGKYLPERDGMFAPQFGFFERRENLRARKPKPEWMARSEAGDWISLSKANMVGFEVEGRVLAVDDREDPIWQDWYREFCRNMFTDAEESNDTRPPQGTLCLITGELGQPVARSHKPEIKGIRGLPPKGASFFSCAKGSPAFSSYGFEMGENAPVSEQAAAAYALALNELLASDDTSFSIGDVAFCFWAEKQTKAAALTCKNISTANPKVVADFLKSPFAGIDREVAKQEQFMSVALSANAGRVVVREWIRMPLERAVENLKEWFEDLQIAALGDDATEDPTDEGKSGPYSLFRLAAAVVRDSKELKRVSETVAELYWAALQNWTPPVGLLDPVLAEFRSALITNSAKKPRYPLNPGRTHQTPPELLPHA